MDFTEFLLSIALTLGMGSLPIVNAILKVSLWIVSLSLFFGRGRLFYWRDWKRIRELKELNKNLRT
jgi:hypothetical protein